ncbi:MFS transporter [Methylomicrobium sp. RS1]|jgi:ACS family tartrate transporter-like MFS transporter|uniref:MFS transporter n=1 Tax=Candidatus Methylomicrobium oryzae TaxID=2802053 RepID=UPI0019245F9A|nr:MFS transporter [Methylomicrobium sp. RS1]MBL1265886.1 MFS transporter [Methylomicrobium sp. RS1]
MPINENQLYRKLAWRLLPPLYIIYILAYLDRMCVGFAQLQMKDALQFSDTVYGFGAGIFFVGYMLFEIPSNLILEKVGAKLWLTRIMVTWGLICCAMVFIETPQGFYILRFLLGLAEAGSFPGMILYFSYWFPAPVRAKYGALLITATAASGVLGAPLAGLLLGIDGAFGLQGWQWLFLAEGAPSVLFGFVLYFWLTNRPAEAGWLNGEEKAWLERTLAAERETAPPHHAADLKQALRHPKVWLLALIYFAVVINYYSISLWLPQLIKNWAGLDNVRTALLTGLPYLAAVIAMVIVGAHSDKTRERRWHIVICAWVAAAAFALSPYLASPVWAIAAIAIAAAGVWSTLAPFWTLPHTLLKEGPAKASGLALINSIGNLGGFAGPYVIAWLKTATGDFKLALPLLAATMASGVLLIFVAVKPEEKTPLLRSNEKLLSNR